jgi:ribonuclease T1
MPVDHRLTHFVRARYARSALMRIVPLAALGLALALILATCSMRAADPSQIPENPASPAQTTPGVLPGPTLSAPAGVAVIALGDLPLEAHQTLDLIAAGGPFPYRQDGVVFQNRERLLPDRPMGHYREYTVRTPGEDDRGARRIVTGADGERYWTDDHYDSFRWISP